MVCGSSGSVVDIGRIGDIRWVRDICGCGGLGLIFGGKGVFCLRQNGWRASVSKVCGIRLDPYGRQDGIVDRVWRLGGLLGVGRRNGRRWFCGVSLCMVSRLGVVSGCGNGTGCHWNPWGTGVDTRRVPVVLLVRERAAPPAVRMDHTVALEVHEPVPTVLILRDANHGRAGRRWNERVGRRNRMIVVSH